MGNIKRKSEPYPIDIFAGERVRELRRIRGMVQEQPAKRIGITFQQIQKYESAANRISASRLHVICEALETNVPDFFTEFYSGRRKQGKTIKILESAEAVELARMFFKMPHKKHPGLYEIGKSLARSKRGKEGNAKITDKPKANPESHPVDVYVGKSIWQFRMITNMSRRQLSQKIDVRHQQIEKYETAGNRVAVSRLYLVCEAFGMSIPEFFADLYGRRKGIIEMVGSREGMKLACLFFRMSPGNRKHFIRLGKNLVEEG